MMVEKKVKELDFYTWRAKEYFKVRDTLRLGQAFLNHFFPHHCDPTLFYCEDDKKCYAMIMEHYIG